MKNIIKIMVLIITMSLLTACPEDLHHDVVAILNIKNSSLKDVVYLPWYISKNYTNDSIFSPQVSPWDNVANYTIKSDSTNEYRVREYHKNAIETDQNLLIFFFDPDTIEQVAWERIARENIILKRVDINSWEELEDCNFEIAYP